MIKKIFFLVLTLAFVNGLTAQTMEELKAKKAELEASIGEKKGEIGSLEGELSNIDKEISYLAGWTKGVSGLVGFDLGKSSKWIANPNPSSSSSALSIGLTGFANRQAPKYFWNNKLIINKAWQDVDLSEADENEPNDGLFDNGTVDLLNLSSLAGYKLTEQIALSGLAELNTSIENFLEPGTFDIGIGATWTPIPNLVVVVHPLNYRVAWSADGDAASQGAAGAKFRADYQDDFTIAGRKIAWSSTLTTFIPYSDKKNMVTAVDQFGVPILSDPDDPESPVVTREAGLFEYTWLNTFSFQVWKGIGVGLNFGLRNAEFEFQDLQSFYSLGLSYTL
ncbi:MAG: DUF3078 domain-containing protein [Bacteroidota bacterium]